MWDSVYVCQHKQKSGKLVEFSDFGRHLFSIPCREISQKVWASTSGAGIFSFFLRRSFILKEKYRLNFKT